MISVIVPVFNVEKYVVKCIDSILKQTYDDLEIILVDDGSTDESGRLCDELSLYDSRIIVIHKENGGLSSARNAGLKIAKGDYITFVDSDDFLDINIYQCMLETLFNKSDNTIANMMYCRVDENNKMTPSSVVHTTDCEIQSEEYLKELLLHVGDVSVCTKLFPSKMVKNLRFIEGKANEDLLFMLEVIPKITTICFIGQVGYYYFSRSGSISSGYGKAICDMVGNSIYTYEYVVKNYSSLKNVAFRFMIYQHMAYLLMTPKEHFLDALYLNSLSLLRKNIFLTISNRYLTLKQKVIIVSLALFPKAMAYLYQGRCYR